MRAGFVTRPGARLYPKLVRSKARFVAPMLLLRKEQLPDDANWLLELKLDGYRALAFKTGGRVLRRSRRVTRVCFPKLTQSVAAWAAILANAP
jgi:ATP-dependent DNA ligase